MGNRNNNRVVDRVENLINTDIQDQYVSDTLISLLVNNEQMQIKKIFAVKNPVYLKRDTLTLERDSSNRNLYYISFSYDAAVPFDINIYFNASKIQQDKIQNSKSNLINDDNEQKIITISREDDEDDYDSNYFYYKPSKNFKNKKISIKNSPKGQNIKFLDRSAIIDTKYFMGNKIEIEDSYDVIIEFVPIFEDDPNHANEIIFYSFCKLVYEESNTGSNNNIVRSVSSAWKIKVEMQKLRTQNVWLDIYEVFNSALENGECLICCHNMRNTLFLPCKHSCTCQNCAHSLRMRNNPCPICKNSIDDLVIVEVDKQN
jgi:hypothetical protein